MTYGTFPSWLHAVSTASIVLALICATTIVIDEVRYPQKMWVMNAVWPLTALFARYYGSPHITSGAAMFRTAT